MNELLKREKKKRKRNKESFNKKNQQSMRKKNKFVKIDGKWQKLNKFEDGKQAKLSANEEFKKKLFGKDEDEEYIPLQKKLKKMNDEQFSEMEKEHAHIFSTTPSTNLEKILKTQREKYNQMKTQAGKKSSIRTDEKNFVLPRYEIKTNLGKNLLNYLNDIKNSDRNIFSEREKENYEISYRIEKNSEFEVPMMIKNSRGRNDDFKVRAVGYKIRFEMNDFVLEKIEEAMKELRGEITKKNKTTEANKNKSMHDKVEEENIFNHDYENEDIFDSVDDNTNKAKLDLNTGFKLSLTNPQNEEDDIFKLKNVDLATLLKPYKK